ncbi:MAG: cytochrome c [Planctomycetales bacterium]|nr:cytochrome c [Planctomycetales bacterium]
MNIRRKLNPRALFGSLAFLATLPMVGCNKTEPVATFEPNWVYAHGQEMEFGYSMASALEETELAIDQMFGTPDSPKLPEFLNDSDFASLISMERLQKAAGPVAEGHGVYRQHCATCHGITGNGRGPTAALLDPYPRDYRAGKFKFKTSAPGSKPLREDLFYSIKHGIDGTSMKAIPELTDEDIEALIDYVIYLSLRGESERALLFEADNVDFENGEHLYQPGSAEFTDQEELVSELITEIADSWVEAAERVRDIPEPGDIPVPATIPELLEQLQADGDTPLKQSVMQGREIFLTEKAACTKCHGKEGRGDGQNNDYDLWTKEWVRQAGGNAEDETALIPLIARGALPPRKIIPRDFQQGLFRGGADSQRIYRRIAEGIEATPMPAAALTPEEIWHLVNFVRSMAVLQEDEPSS